MRLDEPGWWYGPGGTVQARLLSPAAHLWGWIAERRFVNAAPAQVALPVICIGNFTAGGTGKTPLSLAIAGILRQHGRNPTFLTRGYGGKLAGPHWVDADRDSAADAGDEPLLLARRAPVMLARDRAAGARAIAASAAAGFVIIMDDGLQNPALRKDMTIAVVDGRRGIGNGRVIPAGPLRAPLIAQLARVDVIVINQPAGGNSSTDTGSTIGDWFRQRFAGPVLEARTVVAGETASLREKPVLAFAAIGAPGRFFDLLRALGATVVREVAFPDHHPFTATEVRQLLDAARQTGAQLVTTEKDAVRLGAHPELGAAVRTVPIRIAFAPPEQARLDAMLVAMLARHAAAAG